MFLIREVPLSVFALIYCHKKVDQGWEIFLFNFVFLNWFIDILSWEISLLKF